MAPLREILLAFPPAVERLEALPEQMQEDPDIQAAIYSQAREMELLHERLEWLARQLSVTTADAEGLRIIAAELGVSSLEEVPLEERRTFLLAHVEAVGAEAGGAQWEAAITRIVGPGWTYREHEPGSPYPPPPNTIIINLPFPPTSGRYRRTETFIREVTEAHIDLQVQFAGGFILDQSELDQEGLG